MSGTDWSEFLDLWDPAEMEPPPEALVGPKAMKAITEALDRRVVGEPDPPRIVSGLRVHSLDWLPEDRAFSIGVRPAPPAHVGHNSNHMPRLEFDTYDEYERTFPRDLLRYSLSMTFSTSPVLTRPSWLHPFRRTLWVHHHGPQCPEVIPTGAAHRIIKRPSWLRPIKRTLWVHHYGPGVPEQKQVIRVSRAAANSMAVIKGVT